MSTERVPGNALALLSGRVLSAVLMMVVVSLSAHRLDVNDFGAVVATMAAGFLANSLVTFGTDTLVVRAVAADRRNGAAVAAGSLRLQLGGALVFAVVAAITTAVGVTPTIVLIQALTLLPLAVTSVAAGVLRGVQVMGRLLIATTVGATVTLGATLIGFAIDEAAWVPIVAVAIGSVASASIATSFAIAQLPRERGEPTAMRLLLRETAPFAGMVILAAVGAQGGLLLVELAADEPAGGYGAAVRIAEAVRLVPAAVVGAFFPALQDGAHATDRYRQWTQWLVGYALAATAAIVLLAGVINRLVFDSQPDGATLIRILAVSIILTVARLRLSFEFIAIGRERVVLVSAAVGTTVLLVGGLVAAVTAGGPAIAVVQVAGVAAALGVLVTSQRLRAGSPLSAAEA